MNSWDDITGLNSGYVLDLFERYREDPRSVDPASRKYFEQWNIPRDRQLTQAALETIIPAVQLASDIREYGHLAAQLDPLGSKPPGDRSLELTTHNLTEEDLRKLPPQVVGGPIATNASDALEAIKTLSKRYSSTIGYDYDQVQVSEERAWLRDAAEEGWFRPPRYPVDEAELLHRLTDVETFEVFLHRIFVGKTRFSIEGLDMTVPMVEEIVRNAGEENVRHVFLGMAHRGRLNILAHVLKKPYEEIFAEFKDSMHRYHFHDDVNWTGDVKYHKGSRGRWTDGEEINLTITLAPNPSHVELINPVIEGMARAAGTPINEPGAPKTDFSRIVPILLHGDAAFSGQGIVSETLNFSRLPGYNTGGTIHLITNNQIGFTTDGEDLRSTLYASDLAKGFEIPVVHVNADDPIACLEAARLAFAYRRTFHKDFLIDLVGYRRHGHNEGDEPRFTQPLRYKNIADHPTVRAQWADQLVNNGTCNSAVPDALVQERMKKLQKIHESLQHEHVRTKGGAKSPPSGAARHARTAFAEKHLRELLESLVDLPDGFSPNSKLQKAMKRRRELLEDKDARVDWPTAEDLAIASILSDGIPVRFTGEDTERGTFSQRHAVFHDVETGRRYIPLQNIPQAKAAYEVRNSPLTENGTIGFEFGYNIQEPGRLVIWEAQYGDFINNAQSAIDEFLVSGRAKWGQTPSLVLLLPHGYEGKGPDHSTGRLERFLQLAAETNMRIANCTSAAQYFHLLRRQAMLLEKDPLPLIVMTPKSLLRHPFVASPLKALSSGRWQPVIDDSDRTGKADDVERLVFCSGKIAVDLLTSEPRKTNTNTAVIRVEQVYPFPKAELRRVLGKYSNADEITWLQEEPENMGPWRFVERMLRSATNSPIRYLGRPRASSPAEGSSAWHSANQQALIELAFRPNAKIKEDRWVKRK